MPLSSDSHRHRYRYFGFASIGCFILLLALLGLWVFGIIGSWFAYILIPLCPLVYLFLMRWGYEHDNEFTANQSERSLTSAMKMKANQTKARYNRIAWIYDLMEAPTERLFFKQWRSLLFSVCREELTSPLRCKQATEVVTTNRLLEIGVGTGKNLPYYPANVQATAIDISDKMLAKARKKPQSMGVDLRLMDVQRLEFPSQNFDMVIGTFVFCSVPNPVQGLREVRRVLKPEGKLVLLEHVRPENRLLGALFDLLNPVVVRLMGANINRRTPENIECAGLQLNFQYRLSGIFRLMVAQPLKIDDRLSISNSQGGIHDEGD